MGILSRLINKWLLNRLIFNCYTDDNYENRTQSKKYEKIKK